MFEKVRKSLLSGLLLISLAGVLLAYFIITVSLQTVVYTTEQQDFLRYNAGRSISQAPPTINLLPKKASEGGLLAEPGPIGPANFARWENEVQATLLGRYEEEDGVSVTMYDLEFQSTYHFQHPPAAVSTDVLTEAAATLELIFPFPNNLETLHEVQFFVDGVEPLDAQYTPRNIRWTMAVEPGTEHDIAISYKADGARRFSYGLNQDRRTDALAVTMTVKGLNGSEVPTNSLPPTATESGPGGRSFTWRYSKLVANRDLSLTLPRRLSFTQRVAELQADFVILSGLAPFLVGLFLVTLAGLLRLDGVHLPLPGYLLLGLGLTLFYPLLTFLSGLVDIGVAAVAALVLIGGLLLAFLGFMAGWSLALRRLSWLLLIFLGILSLGLLTPWRGLMLTLGGLLLVATFMVTYVRRPLQMESEPTGETEAEIGSDTGPDIAVAAAAPSPLRAYCPQCGRGLSADYDYCPGCGYDGRTIQRCSVCDHEQVVGDDEIDQYCVHCGQIL